MTDPQLIRMSGAPAGHDADCLRREAARADAPVMFIARDDRRLAAMRAALAFAAPDLPVLELPAWDCRPYDRISPSAGLGARRLATMAALARGMSGRLALLTTVNAATQRLPPRETIAASSFTARVGERIDEAGLRDFLARMGFAQAPTVTEPGDYAIRGGIVDVYPPGQSGPVRMDLFGDVLDGARRFDPATQRSTARLKRVDLAPVSEVILDEAAIRRFRSAWRAEFGAAGSDPVYEAVSAGRKIAGVEHWLPMFHEALETVFDYAPGAPVMMDEGLEARRVARGDDVAELYEARRAVMAERKGGSDEPAYRPLPPARLHLDEAAWEAALSARRRIALSASPLPPGPGVIDAGGRVGRDFAPERQAADGSLFAALVAHLRARESEGPVVVAAVSEGARSRLGGLLADEGLSGAREVADARELAPGINLAVWPLETGFEAPGLTVISEQDILGERLIRAPQKRKRAETVLTEARSMSTGDQVVHAEHGIGRYQGLETITAMGAPHDCLALEYAGGDRLYLPVENIDQLSRFGEEGAALDRLGGGAWQARKARAKERIREMADRLMQVAAAREIRRAPVITPPEGMWEAFAARFPYEETDDQLRAIEDVLSDLASGRPMDRLVCGDVGFGKTEVAMRAALAVAGTGRQVALVAPTTLLARQHAESFAERFHGFPVRIGRLSRFTGQKEARETKKGLADGTIDIVVGTHALLADSVRFRDLGLVIVDEEQHFGVAHKERLKALRADVHVLTMTATPIPRTLQMALSGVRELSLIATAPVDRLAIRTYVSEFDTVMAREALLRERHRGGQSFVVAPRIRDLTEMDEFLTREVPEISHVTAHGRMAAGDLDQRMTAFYEGRHDVLLCTSIIESGLDIPAANTMIVHRADGFGLAQLYQIRGRVGRSRERAYCYLTTPPQKPLTPAAERRLKVLGSIDSMGAGFALASQDLDIRGAGNLLGEEQSGQIREVGFELYQSMLEEAIARARAGEGEAPAEEAPGEIAPQISLGVPVLIPEQYVPDLEVRLGLYRRLAELTEKREFEGFAAELIDRFGKLPAEVTTLIAVMRIKAMCKRAGIARLDAGPKGATIRFAQDRFANPAGLAAYLEAQRGTAKVRDTRLVIRRDWREERDRLNGAHAIARDLAEKAGDAVEAAAAES